MPTNEKISEFKVNNIKFKVSDFELTLKHIRKIHAKQKVNNIFVECESFERYIKNDGCETLIELTFWADIKVFGGHKFKPAYNFEIHANINPRYNQIYNTTRDIINVQKGSEDYETLQRFLGFIYRSFDEYIANFVKLCIQVNDGKALTGVPKFVLNVAQYVTDNENINTTVGV